MIDPDALEQAIRDTAQKQCMSMELGPAMAELLIAGFRALAEEINQGGVGLEDQKDIQNEIKESLKRGVEGW